MSVVVPASDFSFAGFYQQEANVKTTFASEGIQVRLEQVGGSTAVRIGQFAVGTSLRRSRYQVDKDTVGPSIHQHSDKLTFNVGAQFKPNSQIALGAVYRRGGMFDFGATRFFGQSKLPVPNSYAGGVALRPAQRLTVTFDINRVGYSVFNSFDDSASQVKDATEFHGGVEYTFLIGERNVPLSFRAGLWTDPDHNPFDADTKTDIHRTFGAGVVVASRVQIDLAASLSKTDKQGIASTVVRF